MARPLRVLWAIKGLGPGGAEMLLASLARVHDPAKVEYSCAYLLPWKDHLVRRMQADGVACHCLYGGGAADLRWAWRLRRLLRAGRFDVVHFHSPYVAMIGRLVVLTMPPGTRPAIVTTEHNVWWSFVWPTRLLNALTAPLDDARAAVSDDVRRSMWPGWRRRTHTVVHGVVPAAVGQAQAHRAAIRAELGIDEDEVVCVTVANYRAQKDYPTLLRAAGEVVRARPDVRFVAVGQGPLEQEIAAEHQRLGLGDRVILTGYREDALAVMAAGDVFVLSSRHEGLPVALMEALTLGLPIVSTAVGGIPEVLRDGREGCLAPAQDPTALARAILRCLDGDRPAMSAAARRTGARFDIRTAERRFHAVYRHLAGEAGRTVPKSVTTHA